MNQFIVTFNTRGAVGIRCVAVVPHYMTMTMYYTHYQAIFTVEVNCPQL